MAGEREITNIEVPQELEVGIIGPDQANRLFIYTGLAHVDQPAPGGDQLFQFNVFINLSKLHNDRKFGVHDTKTAPVAYLANVHGNDDATDFTWAVTNVRAEIQNEELKLFADLFVQGTSGSFGSIAYQVNVTTKTIRLLKLDVVPSAVVRGNTATVKVTLSDVSPMGDLPVDLSTDLPNEFVSFPAFIAVSQGHSTNTKSIQTKTLSGPRPARTPTRVTATFRGDTLSESLDILK